MPQGFIAGGDLGAGNELDSRSPQVAPLSGAEV